jgi:CRISPR-associated endoribonuclease Cas2
MYIILVYDIKSDDEGAKAARKTFKTCKKYLTHIQNSVFEGEISEAQLLALKYEIKNIIRDDRDSLIVFKSRNERWIPKEMWGAEDDKLSNFL